MLGIKLRRDKSSKKTAETTWLHFIVSDNHVDNYLKEILAFA